MKYSEEDIIGYIKQGYKPRVKKVDDRLYVTLRLRNSEKSLGPHNPHLEDTVNAWFQKYKPVDPKKVTEHSRLRGKEMREAYVRVDRRRAEYMRKTCLYIDDGFCTFWRWNPKTLDRINRGKQYFSLKGREEDDSSVLLSSDIGYCGNCPVYQPGHDVVKPI